MMPVAEGGAPWPYLPNYTMRRLRSNGKRGTTITWLDSLAFLIPLFQFLRLPFGGQLLGTETALLVLAPILAIKHGGRLLARQPRTYLLLAALWLLVQILTDIIRDTPFEDLVRGWAKIAFAMINFIALYLLLYGHRRRIILFATGFAGGGILTFYLNPTEYAVDYWWKFGLGIPISLILVLLSTALNVKKWKLLGMLILVAGTLFNLYMDFRSLAGYLALTSGYIALQAFAQRWAAHGAPLRANHVVKLGIALGIAGFAVMQGYEYMVQMGTLGESARRRYEMQAEGEYGIIVGGRSEILASIRAILDSPLLGHGSWAKDCRYTSLLSELKRELGYMPGMEKEDCLIPSHSHVFGASVEAGLLGAVLWLWVLTLPARLLVRLFQEREQMTPIIAFLAFFLLWDVLFSPYGLELRYRTPYEVVVMMTFLDYYSAIRRGFPVSQGIHHGSQYRPFGTFPGREGRDHPASHRAVYTQILWIK
jgi:hypothetical protein